jgi:hypothetical protein
MSQGEEPQKPDSELLEELKRLMATPELQRLKEALTPRIYVTFTQNYRTAPRDAAGNARCWRATYGPYLDVEIADNTMTATTEDEAEGSREFRLATFDGAGWAVEDNMGDAPADLWVRFHTTRGLETEIRDEILRQRLEGEGRRGE